MVPRRRVTLACLIACMALVAACGSSATPAPAASAAVAPPASASTATAMPVASTAPSASASSGVAPTAVQCPSVAAVGAALGVAPAAAAPTGPMITSTSPFGEALTTCDYGDQFKITAKVSFITFSDAASAAASKASTAATGGATAVPNLGDAAYYNNGTLLVYDGPVAAIQISTSNGASADQLAGLVRTLLGK